MHFCVLCSEMKMSTTCGNGTHLTLTKQENKLLWSLRKWAFSVHPKWNAQLWTSFDGYRLLVFFFGTDKYTLPMPMRIKFVFNPIWNEKTNHPEPLCSIYSMAMWLIYWYWTHFESIYRIRDVYSFDGIISFIKVVIRCKIATGTRIIANIRSKCSIKANKDHGWRPFDPFIQWTVCISQGISVHELDSTGVTLETEI